MCSVTDGLSRQIVERFLLIIPSFHHSRRVEVILKQMMAIALVMILGTSELVSSGETRWAITPKQDVQPAASLEGLSLEVGTRVRVARADGSRLDGEFQSSATGVLTLQTDEETLALPEEGVYQIYRVEKRRGKGALRGLFVGLGITALMGLATMTQATESGEGAIGFAVGLMFAVPISVAVGAIASPDRRELIYENPAFLPPEARAPPTPAPEQPEAPAPPPPQQPPVAELPRAPQLPLEIPKSFYLGVSGGASYLGGEPLTGATTTQPSPSATYTVQGLYRASEHWGFGGEILFTDAGTWTWERDDMAGADSRTIVAPGFKVYYFPVVGTNEIVLNGGVSAFKQDSTRTVDRLDSSQTFAETKLNPYFNVGLSYHRYVHPNFGVGAELQYYNGGMQIPNPLVLFSVSLSFRATPPPTR